MSKAANIYWDKPEAIRRNANGEKVAARTAGPRWMSFVLVTVMAISLCLAINYRAFSELRVEIKENRELNDQIQNLTDENLSLQDEIHNLKTDPKTIEREARKLGLARSTEKSLVSGN